MQLTKLIAVSFLLSIVFWQLIQLPGIRDWSDATWYPYGKDNTAALHRDGATAAYRSGMLVTLYFVAQILTAARLTRRMNRRWRLTILAVTVLVTGYLANAFGLQALIGIIDNSTG